MWSPQGCTNDCAGRPRRSGPKVALALSGWLCLQTDGMTDRINADAPEDYTDGGPIR